MTRTITIRLISPTTPGVRTPLTSNSPRLTVGRDPAADWALPDPARLLSRLHFEISNDAEGVVAHDHSANGLAVNSAVEPVGKGNKIALNTGDLLRFGPYVAEILIAEASAIQSDAQRDGLAIQSDIGQDRAARLAALAAFEPDLAENTDCATTDSSRAEADPITDCIGLAAPTPLGISAAQNAFATADPIATLSDFERQTRILIPEDWNDDPATKPLSQQDHVASSEYARDAQLAALDALAKLACAVDPVSQGHPYASALHDFTLTGRISFHDVLQDIQALNQKVIRLLSGQTTGGDFSRLTHEH